MSNTFLTIIIFAVGIIVSLLAFLLNRSLFKKMDDMSESISAFTKEIQEFREMVLRDFVMKTELQSNDTAHNRMWSDINNLRDRISKLESG